ncbi:VapC toxin family PIN domain ribonuclease [Pleomorphomonas diazotrophica]|uniref:VapC toxin family PIN domain ribonuclease n=1 Tax=Pleomorphomonas diazotrophica TaxID=1166257 RepID=A0A1I4WP67_9HYPH|nr:type II toxin-antitoxin system VapC family toxin [Pleomorphomonas diazotrophica]PKR87192.1 VapC toxin family PIN domain ribonuclease [Pleomorphomonas diazotrophica]SFN15032.1 ribonuclease VapC [Pleomorphomonas diazotrophica]
MFVDASAMIAMIAEEPDGEMLAGQLQTAPPAERITSVIAVWEAVAGLHRLSKLPLPAIELKIRSFLATASIEVIPLTLDHLSPALDAFDRYGRHRLPESERNKALNLGDCFHYAAARRAGTGILHKDAGLAFTDLPPA